MANNSHRHIWFYAGALLALMLAAMAGIVVLLWAIDSLHQHHRNEELHQLVSILESGELSFGDEHPLFPKPTTDSGYTDGNGRLWFCSFTLSDSDAVVLYSLREAEGERPALFAAQHFDWRETRTEKWYFCDPDLMAQYVTIATREPESP